MEQILIEYLTHLNIPISSKYFEKLITSHPDYPSLLSIADTLERLGINHNIVRLSNDRLADVPFPYLVKPVEGRRNLTSVEEEYDLTQYLESTEQEQSVILQVQPTNTIKDEEHNRQRLGERFLKGMAVTGLVAVAGLLVLSVMQTMTWVHALLLLTALVGTVVGYLLIAKEVGVSYKLVESFCQAGGKTNCDAVLRSDGAQLFGNLTLSDATAGYFLFQMLMFGLLIPLSGGAATYFGMLGLLSLLAVPVVFYSLYYQAMRVKTWCRLCLLVDAVLIGQAGLFGYMYSMGIISIGSVSALFAALTLLLFAATGSVLVLVKSVIKDKNESLQREVEANRIKYSPEVFLHLLRRQERVNITPFKQEMLIGDPKAPINVTMAASLGCGPCKAGFERVTRLVATWPDTVNMAVRLRTGSANKNNGEPAPGTWLLGWWLRHIYGQPDASVRTEELLLEWYNLMDLKQFSRQYPLETDDRDNGAIEKLGARHIEWFEEAGITGTPTFFINSYKLPQSYRVEDLMGMVPGLVDQVKQQKFRQKTLETDKKIVPTVTGGDNRG